MPDPRELAVGETADKLPIVEARKRWNSSGLRLVAGQTYEIRVEDVVDWKDADIDFHPEGGHIQQRRCMEWAFVKRFRRCREKTGSH